MAAKNVDRIPSIEDTIIQIFRECDQNTFKISDIEVLAETKLKSLRIPNTLTSREIQELLTSQGIVRRFEFQFPKRKEIRFAHPSKSTYEVALSLRQDSYLTHLTSLFLHGFSDEQNNTIFVNWEQKRGSVQVGDLSQWAIDNAFSRPQRIAIQNRGLIDNYKILLLNGRNTNRLGIILLQDRQLGSLKVTDVERTLIDITVRPEYAGGMTNVLEAFKQAKQEKKVSVEKLVSYLKILSYTYPYHQAIGFYMERSLLYKKKELALLQSFPMDYDFYLGYNIELKDYSPAWRLYYPKYL